MRHILCVCQESPTFLGKRCGRGCRQVIVWLFTKQLGRYRCTASCQGGIWSKRKIGPRKFFGLSWTKVFGDATLASGFLRIKLVGTTSCQGSIWSKQKIEPRKFLEKVFCKATLASGFLQINLVGTNVPRVVKGPSGRNEKMGPPKFLARPHQKFLAALASGFLRINLVGTTSCQGSIW